MEKILNSANINNKKIFSPNKDKTSSEKEINLEKNKFIGKNARLSVKSEYDSVYSNNSLMKKDEK